MAPPTNPAPGESTSDGAGGTLDLRSAVIRGLAWKSLFVVVVQVTRIVSGVILVRLLLPSDYGLAGMATLFSSLVLYVSDLGLGSALIQRESITEKDRSTVFWTTVALGVMFTLTAIALAGPVASFFHRPRVKDLFMVLSITFVIGSLGTTQASLIHRSMAFRAISIRLMIATVGGCTTALAVAASGGGPWALIAQEIAVTVLSTTFLWLTCDWRPSFVYSWASLKDLAGFGTNVVGSSILGFLQGNTDNILIGRYLGSSALGIYSVAYNVILLPIGKLIDPVQETLFPALSRIQSDPARVARIWLRAVRGVSAIIMPTMLGLIVVAPDFVDVVLGERWHRAIPVIRILAVVSLLLGFSAVAGRTLLALDRSRVVLYFAATNTALIVPAFVIGLSWGIVGVAASYAIVTVPIQAAGISFVARILNISASTFVRNVAGVTQAALLMAATCWLCREGLLRLDASRPLRLVVVILVGIVTYLIATHWLNPDIIEEAKRFRRRSVGPDQGDPDPARP